MYNGILHAGIKPDTVLGTSKKGGKKLQRILDGKMTESLVTWNHKVMQSFDSGQAI